MLYVVVLCVSAGLQGGGDLDGRPPQAEESPGAVRQGNRSGGDRHGYDTRAFMKNLNMVVC